MNQDRNQQVAERPRDKLLNTTKQVASIGAEEIKKLELYFKNQVEQGKDKISNTIGLIRNQLEKNGYAGIALGFTLVSMSNVATIQNQYLIPSVLSGAAIAVAKKYENSFLKWTAGVLAVDAVIGASLQYNGMDPYHVARLILEGSAGIVLVIREGVKRFTDDFDSSDESHWNTKTNNNDSKRRIDELDKKNHQFAKRIAMGKIMSTD